MADADPTYRDSIPAVPKRLQRLPVHRGYPVPWFVTWVNQAGRPQPPGDGTPEFRLVDGHKLDVALRARRCWVCGQPIPAGKVAFVVGPMCTVNRISAEPPCHQGCALWSARACPFLANPKMVRREGLPGGAQEPPGRMLLRNPGVAVVWITERYAVQEVDGGKLVHLGHPEDVVAMAHGREATDQELLEALRSGLPALREMAREDGPEAVDNLRRDVEDAMHLLGLGTHLE